MKKKIMAVILICIAIFTSACGSKSSLSAQDRAPQKGAIGTSENKNVSNGTFTDAASPNSAQTKQTSQKIIQNYEIYIEVEDLKKVSSEIEDKVKNTGGYIENQEVMDTTSYASARVPSDKLDNFIKDLEKNYIVTNKRKETQNITDAYVDNDARLKNFKAEETQMMEVLKKANTVEDILKVQSELFRIRAEIESLESQKKTWDKLVDYSTVTIRMNRKQIAASRFVSIISGSEFIKSITKGFANSFLYVVLALEKLIIFVISNIFVLAILAAASIFIYRRYKVLKKNENK